MTPALLEAARSTRTESAARAEALWNSAQAWLKPGERRRWEYANLHEKLVFQRLAKSEMGDVA